MGEAAIVFRQAEDDTDPINFETCDWTWLSAAWEIKYKNKCKLTIKRMHYAILFYKFPCQYCVGLVTVTVYGYNRTTYGFLTGMACTIVGPYMAHTKSLTVRYGHNYSCMMVYTAGWHPYLFEQRDRLYFSILLQHTWVLGKLGVVKRIMYGHWIIFNYQEFCQLQYEWGEAAASPTSRS